MATTSMRSPHRHLNLRCFNPQFFIASRVGDAALEEESEQLRPGSLDARMRTVVDALRVLCAALPADGLLPADRLALDRLNALGQRADWDATRDGAGDALLTTDDVDDLLRRLRRLRHEDPELADQILRRLMQEAGTPAVPTS
jgi:hypothetical protein